jgi:hypothetical protein
MDIERIQFRKTPVIFAWYFLLVEFLAVAVSVLPSLIIDYEKLYISLNFHEILEFSVFVVVFEAVSTLLVVVFLLVAWSKSVYVVRGRSIVQKTLFRQREYRIGVHDRLVMRRGTIYRILNYGTVDIIDPCDKRVFSLANVVDPAYVFNTVEQLMKRRDDTPRFQSDDYRDIILHGEDQYTEFKASLSWDVRRGISSKEVLRGVMKTLAAFMNSAGGVLFIGVADDRSIVGLDADIKTLKRKDIDGFENYLTMVFSDLIGAEYRDLLVVKFEKFGDKLICVITVSPSKEPVFVKDGKIEEFFIRAGNATYPLSVKPATQYIESHFRGGK